MKFLQRLSNLWKLSELKPWDEENPKTRDRVIQSLFKPQQKATVIPYQKVDPVKAITEQEA